MEPAQDDVAGLRRDMGRLVADLAAQKAEAAASTATLAALDRVKTRMEAACSTLKVPARWHACSGDQHVWSLLCQALGDHDSWPAAYV